MILPTLLDLHRKLALKPIAAPTGSSHSDSNIQSASRHPATSADAVPSLADLQATCEALDFAPHDAACVAAAWLRQSQRLGHFDAHAWPSEAQDFGLGLPQLSTSAFARCPQRLGLYAVLPDADWVAQMAHCGVPTLQLRFKSPDQSAVRAQIDAAVRAVQGTQSLLFINDHWQEAIEAGAYGVHLGQEDMDTANLAKIRQAGLRLGLSSHGYAEMLKAAAVEPSYIAMGAVYATTLKQMATPPQGPARLAAYARLVQSWPHIGSVAIGGIDEARLDEVLPSGVGSVAVVRAITGAADPEAAAKRLMHRLALVKSQAPR